MRNVVKSVRLDEALPLSSLPHGNLNPLINELLTLYFEDEEVYERVLERDPRLIRTKKRTSPQVEKVVNNPVPAPDSTSPVQVEAQVTTAGESLIDSILPS